MITALLFDLSWVLLFPADPDYDGDLNPLHEKLRKQPSYRLFDHFKLNEALLDFLKKRKDEYVMGIFTAGTIQEEQELYVKLVPIFNGRIFSAEQLGRSKRDPEAYRTIALTLGKEPREILFIDDYLPYIRAAKSAGLNTIQYQSNEKLIGELDAQFGTAE